MSVHLAWSCYVENRSLQFGKLAVFGAEYAFPECYTRLRSSRENLLSWKKFAVVGDGAPIPWEGLHGIAAEMASQGHEESADIAKLSGDLYLRESDWSLAQDSDVAQAPGYGVSLRLGVAERG